MKIEGENIEIYKKEKKRVRYQHKLTDEIAILKG